MSARSAAPMRAPRASAPHLQRGTERIRVGSYSWPLDDQHERSKPNSHGSIALGIGFDPSSLKRDLHVDPVGIVDVQAMIGIVTDAASALGQIACSGFLGETGYANREVIDNFGRALTVQRDQSPVRTETNDSERLVLADDGEVEHFLIEVDGTLQVRNLNADMVDVRGLEIDIVLGSSGRRSGGCHHRETSNQLPTAEGALLELAHKIGNDRFHDDSFLFGGKTSAPHYRACSGFRDRACSGFRALCLPCPEGQLDFGKPDL